MNKIIATKSGQFVLSLAVTLVGEFLAWLGFVYPGLIWCSNFVNTEMISLVVVTFVGVIGLFIMASGFVMFCQNILYADSEDVK